MRALVAGVAVAAVLAGCGGDERDEADCPQQPAVSQGSILSGAGGWAFGQRPVYVAFLDLPMYRGEGSFVAIHRDLERNGRYAVKLMTILHPTFAGTVRQEISVVTPGRRAAFGLGSSSDAPIEDLQATRTLEVDRRTDLVPGQVVFSGPGCYRIALEAQDRRYEFSFPVRFEPAERRVASLP